MKRFWSVLMLLVLSMVFVSCSKVDTNITESRQEKPVESPKNSLETAKEYIIGFRYNEAEDVLFEAYNSEQNNLEVYETILDLYFREKRYEDMVDLFEKDKNKLESDRVWILSATGYYGAGNYEEFGKIIEGKKIEEINDSYVLEKLAEIYLDMEDESKLDSIANSLKKG